MFALICFGILYLYLFAAAFLPYLRYDQSHYWDLPGHLFAAWFNRHYLFPNFTGWNPFFFAGYPQNTFYGPLHEYLVVLFSFPLGLLNSQKLISILMIAALPLSIYYFLRKSKFDQKESSVMVLLCMLPVVSLSLACGGTLYSLFYVGLAPNALAIPLFFIYTGKLKEQCEKLNSGEAKFVSAGNFLLLTLLVILITLSHFVVLFASFVAALILFAYYFNKNILNFALRHTLVSILCLGFFLVPLLSYLGGVKDDPTILSMGFFLTIPLFLLIIFGGAAAVLDKDKRFNASFYMLIAAFAVMVFIDFGQFGLPIDAYRFIVFFLIFSMILPAKMIMNQIPDKLVKNTLLILFGLLLLVFIISTIQLKERAEINRNQFFFYKDMNIPYEPNIELEKIDGRLITFEKPERRTPRALRHTLAMRTKNHFLEGMFAESSANAVPSLKVTRKLQDYLSTKEDSAKKTEKARKAKWLNTVKLLNLYQINYLLSEFPVKGLSLVKTVKIRRDREPFFFYKLGESKLAELLPYKPYTRDRDWKRWVSKWMDSPDPKILVKALDLPEEVASSRDSVKILEQSIVPARLKLEVSAEHRVPILIKMSYFPRWRAYEEGQPIKIYEVAPSLMLVYGKGRIELKYKNTAIDYFGYLLTLIGVGFLIFEFNSRKDLTK